MHQRLKERLVGAAVLIIIAVVFIPMFLTGPIDAESITETNIPERTTEKFNSRLIPLNNSVTETQTNVEAIDVEESLNIDDKKNVPTAEANIESDTNSESVNVTEASSKKPEPSKSVKDKQVGLTAWVVQLGSFSSKVNADKLNLTLRKSGFPAFVEPLEQDNQIAYRVRVGPELLRADADTLLKKIKQNTKLDGIVLNYP